MLDVDLYLKVRAKNLWLQSWEYGLPLCEELAAVYKSKILYEKLSFILVCTGTFTRQFLAFCRLLYKGLFD